MGYEVSQRFKTRREPRAVMDLLEDQFRKVAKRVVREGDHIVARTVAGSMIPLGKNYSVIRLARKDDGYLCVADVNYTQSFGLALAFFILLFLWVIPAVVLVALFYLGKKPVREAVERVLARVRDEVED